MHMCEVEKGISTIEILIALALLSIVVSAVLQGIWGSQSLAQSSTVASQALWLGEQMLADARDRAYEDFRLLGSTTTTSGIYEKKLTMQIQNYATYAVTAEVSWNTAGIKGNTSLSTLISNWAGEDGSETCSSVVEGDWGHPVLYPVVIGSDVGALYGVTDIDVDRGKLYLTMSNTSGTNKNNLYMYDIASSTSPVFLSATDNDATIGTGISAVHIAGRYAYIARATGPTRGQLQIIDISVSPPALVSNFIVPGVTGSSGQAIGSSIFYKNGLVYLGLTKTGSGPEFHIIDVSNPALPVWKIGWNFGASVNAIYVRDSYAYVVTPNSEELTVLDISNPAFIHKVSAFDAPGSSGNGKSLDIVGDELSLGRTTGGTEFYSLNTSEPLANPLSFIASQDLGTGGGISINGILMRGVLRFLLTNNQLKIITRTGSTFSEIFSSVLPEFITSGGSSLACEGNYLFAASENGNTFYVIGPGN